MKRLDSSIRFSTGLALLALLAAQEKAVPWSGLRAPCEAGVLNQAADPAAAAAYPCGRDEGAPDEGMTGSVLPGSVLPGSVLPGSAPAESGAPDERAPLTVEAALQEACTPRLRTLGSTRGFRLDPERAYDPEISPPVAPGDPPAADFPQPPRSVCCPSAAAQPFQGIEIHGSCTAELLTAIPRTGPPGV